MTVFKTIMRTVKIRKGLTIVTEGLGIAANVAKNPNPINIAHQAAMLFQKGTSVYTNQYSAAVVREKWQKLPLSNSITNMAFTAMSDANGALDVPEENMVITEMGDGSILVHLDNRLYVPPDASIDTTLNHIGRTILEKVGPRYMLDVTKTNFYTSIVEVKSVPLTSMPSKRADDLFIRVEAFLDNHISRSIFMYGPPGTGKSCLAAAVAEKVGGTCMRGPTEHAGLKEILEAVKLFRPDVFIMDDMGYANEPSASFLATLEELNKLVKLLIVTSNTISLAPALIRPGRFDEVTEILTLGPEVLESIIGDVLTEIDPPIEVLEEISKWPAAFVKELANRVRTLGTISFMREFKLLQNRVAGNVLTTVTKEDKAFR